MQLAGRHGQLLRGDQLEVDRQRAQAQVIGQVLRRSDREAPGGASRCLPLEASVRCGWRESSKRSSASVGADAPFRGKGIARPEQPQEPKQSCRAQAPHALDVADCDSAPSWLGGRLRARTTTSCVGMDRIEGGRDLDHRAVAWFGLAVISSLPARSLLPIVHGDNAQPGELRAPNPWQSSRVG